jgi:iron(III) transport system permease protein
VVVRSRIRFSGLYDALAFIPHAVPHLIFAVAAVVLALFWVPSFVPLYNTVFILFLVYALTRLCFVTRIYNSALVQIHRELDEAGYVFGLGSFAVARHILRPLLAPAILYTWLWTALLVYRELTMAVFLSSSKNYTMTVVVWNIWSGGDMPGAMAVSLLMLICMMPLVVLYLWMGRRRLDLE